MKIREVGEPTCLSIRLGQIDEGNTVRFVDPIHDKHRPGDVFIVNEVCSSYVPDKLQRQRPRALGVTNLRTGSLAYLDQSRRVEIVKAEVCLL